ncbi:MAG: hypothetical protein IJV26_04275 [Lachnospiraceae bacterium]|nr:hypothetical protein [Lachnospiraceae bacterium]
MNDLNKLNLRKYAIPNLSLVLIICYAFGYLIAYINPTFADYLTLNPNAILHGQIWRIISWILIPPGAGNILFTAIMLYFYYSIGTTLERTWGTWRYNVYLFSGFLFTLAGAFVMMGCAYLIDAPRVAAYGAAEYFRVVSRSFSTYYVNMSIFLAFAATYPDMQVLLMFLIPIRVKWLGILDAVMLTYDAIVSPFYIRIAIIASLLNFLIFWLRSGTFRHLSPKQIRRRAQYRQSAARGEAERRQTVIDAQNAFGKMKAARHRCCICGKTELDSPDEEFRFCSKCAGNREYCSEHLYTHVHVTQDSLEGES